jgi:hypothetical protein
LSASRAPNGPSGSQNALSPTQNATSPGRNATSELAGTLKSIDKDKHSLTIAPATGDQQDVKLADSTTITRGGSKIDLDQLQPGDDVRASFDPATRQAATHHHRTVESDEQGQVAHAAEEAGRRASKPPP